MTNKSRVNALVFREAASAVPGIVDKLFNDDPKRPKIKATNINGRETVRKIFKERGNNTQTMLPIIGCKLVQLGAMEEGGVNQFALKKSGAVLGQADGGDVYVFYGKQVMMQYQLTMFTNNYDDIIKVAADSLMMASEMSIELTIDPGIIFPCRVSFDQAAFSIPDISQEGEIPRFEFELPGMAVRSYVGYIDTRAALKTISTSGGPIQIDESGRKIVLDRTVFDRDIES